MLKKSKGYADVALILFFAVIPLALSFPYRVNIFLSWEGAYRISEGQLPFRDFGTPLGGMFWVIPGLFFKLFGPQMITLIKAQVFINIISGLAFRSLLKSFGVDKGLRFLCVMVYCISFSFFNFWPWYNHTVIVYEFAGLAFIMAYILGSGQKFRFGYIIAGAICMLFSFLTKQDGGGMAILIGAALLGYHALTAKDWKAILLYGGAFTVFLLTAISIFGSQSFGYWFNHGQAPHSSRVSPFDLITEFLSASQWIKFYLFIILILMLPRFKSLKALWQDRTEMLFLILTLCILGEALVFQVTSYTPPDNNIFFHSFAIAFILYKIGNISGISFSKPAFFIAGFAGIMLWWSGTYWKYFERLASQKLSVKEHKTAGSEENLVNRNTYMLLPVLDKGEPENKWMQCGLKSFDKIFMPSSTAKGIQRLMNMDLVKEKKPLKVLNMSELTPLAAEIPFELERNPALPLWHHLGVGMFNRQAEIYEQRIGNKHYDLVLFEYIPYLNNFYPFRVRDSLRVHYQLIDSFAAPRRGETQGQIEVYVR